MSSFMANLEAIDKPLPNCPISSTDILDRAPPTLSQLPSPLHVEVTQPRRISRLGPIALTPCAEAGPSRGQRYLYVAVRRGRIPGVYTDWKEAEKQVIDHPDPVFKTFSTKMAAEAYINGWDGGGRHSVPGSCPKPLREHLAMNFPSSVPLSSPSKRPSYHARLVASAPSLSTLPESTDSAIHERPPLSYRRSQVRISSPLCRQVDEEPIKDKGKKAASWVTGAGGLLSPPPSPKDDFARRSIVDRDRPTPRKSSTDSSLWSSSRRDSQRSISTSANASTSSIQTSQRLSGLWADSVPMPTTPSPEVSTEPDLASSAPKFSRSAMRKSAVIMPAAAPRSNSSSSLRSRLSRNPSNTSLSSMVSSSSTDSLQTLRRRTLTPRNSQDRLSTLAETSKAEMRVDEHGSMVFASLAPPRPAFMQRSSSSSSVSSDASGLSMSSLTSASSAMTSSLESCSPIPEEEDRVQIRITDYHESPTCTKSDADALSQISAGKKPKKGGLFRRFSRALKLDRGATSKTDAERRGSL